MTCHNGAGPTDPVYAGPGLSNPHPFGSQAYLDCTNCHGGNPEGLGRQGSHVPPPPAIANDALLENDATAYFNYLTRTGVDRYADYTVDGVTYTADDWIQFMNPGDTRTVSKARGCGQDSCHGANGSLGNHADWVRNSPLNTEVGFYSATMYTSGVENLFGDTQYQDTAADYGFRAVVDTEYDAEIQPSDIGRVRQLAQFPEYAQYGVNVPNGIYQNPAYTAAALNADVHAGNLKEANRIFTGSNLERLVEEVVALNCGDCHLGSMGANNRYGDFRSSGCSSCHMQYSLDGISRSTDPNVPKNEPANADAIAAPERPHIDSHQIRNVAKFIQGGFIRGINDNACVGCHQGSNRTVLQYWGIRLDQNQDLVNEFQYPANPVGEFVNTAAWTQNGYRLYDAAVGNVTFNGRIADQYIAFEDYDGDTRDDTPPDIHFEKGMGCIDCHSSMDVHAGTLGQTRLGIRSREDQAMAVQCESCHGGIEDYPATVSCLDYDGQTTLCATDYKGNPMRNVTTNGDGHFWVRGRVDGQLHYVPLTRDTVDLSSGKNHPITQQLLYSPLASYAMGRVDGNTQNGVGPMQADPVNSQIANFSHEDNLECVACHSSWTNNCIGCHLAPEYNADPANFFFSNTTGDRISLNFAADFVYQSPVMFNIGVGSRDLITQTQPGMKMFFRYTDLNGDTSDVFAFTDRNGNGNNPADGGRGNFGALAHNKIMPHSTRGAIDNNNEGPRYCNSCHITQNAIDNFGADYAAFKDDLYNGNFANLDFAALATTHIGQNTNNQNDSPIWVHMVAGLGSGLFLFDADGCPVNPLDANANRQFCNNVSPQDRFADQIDNVVYALDHMVEPTGISNSSHGHPMLSGVGSVNRNLSRNPAMAGPLGFDLLDRLTNENSNNRIILDGWIDSDGALQGTAADFVIFP